MSMCAACPARPLVLSRLTAAPYHLTIARHHAIPRHAAQVSFRLSAAASVQVRLVRLLSGHRRGGACRARGRGPACTILRSVVTLHVNGRTGANPVTLPRKGRGWSLTPGRYEVIVSARNTANGRSMQLFVRFTVAQAPRKGLSATHVVGR